MTTVYHIFICLFAALVCVSGQEVPVVPTEVPTREVNMTLREELKSAKVMLCAILKAEQLYIDEWLEYHRYLGYDYAELYDNAEVPSPYLAGLHEKYGDFINVTHFPGSYKQIDAYRSCVKRNVDRNMWSSFLDIDEFIVLRSHNSIKEFLHDVAPDGGSVVLNWSMFGGSDILKHEPGPVLVRFIMTTVGTNPHIKSTAYLPHVLDPNIHNCQILPGHPTVTNHGRLVSSNTPFVHLNDREIANINHYNTKSVEEFVAKRRRGRASSVALNNVYRNHSEETHDLIMREFHNATRGGFQKMDTVARDFYLKHHLRLPL